LTLTIFSIPRPCLSSPLLIHLFRRLPIPPTPTQRHLIVQLANILHALGMRIDLYRCSRLWPPSLFMVRADVCAPGEGEGTQEDAGERERREGEVHVGG
jgi:hypothetical protein